MTTQSMVGVSESNISEVVCDYRITIAGSESRFRGTQPELWQHVSEKMANQPSGTIPKIDEIKPPALVNARTHREAMDQAIDPEGQARSTTDLLAAQAGGFTPKQPYYDRGRLVIGLGAQNARESHCAWEAQAKLRDAGEKFDGIIRAENRRDEMIGIEHLAMYGDGTLTGKNAERWLIEPDALVQLAVRLGIRNAAYLVNIWPALRAQNWNQMIATSTRHEKSTCPKEHALYTSLDSLQTVRARLRDSEGKPSLWAVLSDRYATFDVDKVAAALVSGLAKYPEARCEVTYDGHSAQFDVLFHSNVQPEKYVAGEFFKAGYRVKTSDAGGGSIHIALLIWQNLCLNLLCIDVATFTLARLRHIGSSEVLAAKFAEAVKQGEQRLGHFLRAWNFATDETLVRVAAGRYAVSDAVRVLDEMPSGDTFTEAEVLAGVFHGLKKSDKLTITNDDIVGLVAAHALDESSARVRMPVTRASIVNAVTRYAHETVGRLDPAKQSELESQAGALLIGTRGGNPLPLPFMPPRRVDLASLPH